ncbi:MAG: hypothetical protein U9P63_02965 [Patescibacteria group bacterium]|nr:hypothetical protein [Patescibacteria group bacterium]
MEITKCDVCGKIKDKNSSYSDSGWTGGHILAKKSLRFDFCDKCSIKFMRYLNNYLKIKRDKKNVKKK